MRTSIFLAKLAAAPLTALGIGMLLNRSIYRRAAHEFLASAALNTLYCFLASLGQLGLRRYQTA
jgi:hypothetical protein